MYGLGFVCNVHKHNIEEGQTHAGKYLVCNVCVIYMYGFYINVDKKHNIHTYMHIYMYIYIYILCNFLCNMHAWFLCLCIICMYGSTTQLWMYMSACACVYVCMCVCMHL